MLCTVSLILSQGSFTRRTAPSEHLPYLPGWNKLIIFHPKKGKNIKFMIKSFLGIHINFDKTKNFESKKNIFLNVSFSNLLICVYLRQLTICCHQIAAHYIIEASLHRVCSPDGTRTSPHANLRNEKRKALQLDHWLLLLWDN